MNCAAALGSRTPFASPYGEQQGGIKLTWTPWPGVTSDKSRSLLEQCTGCHGLSQAAEGWRVESLLAQTTSTLHGLTKVRETEGSVMNLVPWSRVELTIRDLKGLLRGLLERIIPSSPEHESTGLESVRIIHSRSLSRLRQLFGLAPSLKKRTH